MKLTDEQKEALRWARDIAVAGNWQHVKPLNALLAAQPIDAEPVALTEADERKQFDVFAKEWWWSEGGDEDAEMADWHAWRALAALDKDSK